MGAIYKNSIKYSGGGGSAANERELTQAEYDLLTPEEKMNGTNYFITDGEGGGSGGGGGIPTPTTADIGKILTVDDNVNVAWGEASSGADIPTPTTADVGKILTVDDNTNIAWSEASGSDVFCITFTQSQGVVSCDKTYQEIITALNAKKMLNAVYDPTGGIAPQQLTLKAWNPGAITFESGSTYNATYPVDNICPINYAPAYISLSVQNTCYWSGFPQNTGVSFLYTDVNLNYELDRDFLNIYVPMVEGIIGSSDIGKNVFNVLVVGGTNTLEYYTMSHIDDTKVQWSRIITNSSNQVVIEIYTLDGSSNTNKTVVKTTKILA